MGFIGPSASTYHTDFPSILVHTGHGELERPIELPDSPWSRAEYPFLDAPNIPGCFIIILFSEFSHTVQLMIGVGSDPSQKPSVFFVILSSLPVLP